ncbi:uncharacterized protein AMSG_09327 [Thecamonas trahens ATCC 50062]|uniref:Uncharacterized protein n=1 Tax=Thecamonas trahens ATCC 50062 TaxID=461836 RepID=A0A0L0DL94_THETB|nr:hypothetical protein AMSG_09327 [Thecamonas trahens ATCC 50062]KNC53035.1 hypothetical protein AMSG_09327 [Thecamonas trahens ATCC 50062]|eukprot:XP_013754713.1 hypothetical protein AMSG_09327 [Thecamonas trahens ATCC 50062]
MSARPSLGSAGSLVAGTGVRGGEGEGEGVVDPLFDATYSRLELVAKEQRLERLVLESKGLLRTGLLRRGLGKVSELCNPPSAMLRDRDADFSSWSMRYVVPIAGDSAPPPPVSRATAYGRDWTAPPEQWERLMHRHLAKSHAARHAAERQQRYTAVPQPRSELVRSDNTVPSSLPARALADHEFQRRYVNGAYKAWLLDNGHPIPDDLRDVVPHQRGTTSS